MLRPFAAALGAGVLLACFLPSGAGRRPPVLPPHGAAFFDRAIALEPFISGFPFANFQADLEHGALFYLDRRESYTLRMLELGDLTQPGLDLAAGQAVSSVDWSKRSLRGVKLHAASRTLWLSADERNDEKLNLWTLRLADQQLEQVTHTDYIYGFGFSEDQKQLAYIGRRGAKAPFETCVFVVNLAKRAERQIVCDQPELRFTWGEPHFSPDGRELYFNAQLKGDRARSQLVRLDLFARKQARPHAITDPRIKRDGPRMLDGWLRGDALLFLANDDGYRNLYRYSRGTGRMDQLTHFREDVFGAALTERGVFLAHGTPRGSTVEVVDPRTGKSRATLPIPGEVSILDGRGDRVLWTQQGPSLPFEADVTELKETKTAVGLETRRVVELAPALADQIVQCQAERVEIPTFDTDPATGQPRLLHAFVLSPRTPQPDARRLALIRSFYGGENGYNSYDHVMCAAGMLVISPAVRGSAGFGREFSALNDKDLGGDEVVDLFRIARWVQERFKLEPERIGVYGRSHGGFETMRALTFPPETNGRNESFPFGFGMAESGFSDIAAFHDASNIPDWVVLEAGDPAVPADRARLADRSPLNHVDLLRAPIFLMHGSNDWRVPVAGSRAFVDRARALGKPITYVEVEGQGHNVEGLDRIAAAYQARFDFLMSLPVLAERQKE